MTTPTQAEIEQARKELECLCRFQCGEIISRDVFGSWAVRNLKVLSYILNAEAEKKIEPQVNFSWEQPE